MAESPEKQSKGGEHGAETQHRAQPDTLYHSPPEDGIQYASPTADSEPPATQDGPYGSAPQAVNAQQNTSNERHQRYERIYWAVTGTATVVAACAAIAAAVYATSAYRETRRQADAAVAQSDIAQKTLDASERPWLSVSLANNGPVTFEDSGAQVRLLGTVKNHDRVPAQEVNILSEVYPLNTGNPDYSDGLLVQQKRVCDR